MSFGGFMKSIALFTVTILSISGLALAQEKTPPEDFGGLLQDDIFHVKNDASSFRVKEDIVAWDLKTIEGANKREEFDYKSAWGKGTRKNLVGKRQNHKLIIERADSKVKRMSQLTWLNTTDAKYADQHVGTWAFTPEGYLESQTECGQYFKKGILGTRAKNGNAGCVTINSDVCKYFEEKKIDKDLQAELYQCSETFRRLGLHQETLAKLSSKDSSSNISALKKIEKNLEFDNFYEMPTKSLAQVSQTINGYMAAINHCAYAKDKGWIKPDAAPQVQDGGTSGGSVGTDQ